MNALETIADGTPLVIPVVPDLAYTSQRLSLDGQIYTLDLSWNQWHGGWYFSLYDFADVAIVQSARIVSNFPLLRYYADNPACPPGELIAQDLTGDGSPPGFGELGERKRVELTYISQTQV